MKSVSDARAWAIDELKRAREKSPVLSADLLLAFVLGWDRVRVLTHPEECIPEGSWIQYRDLVLRRSRGEPLQYLTGVQEFYGLDFLTKPGALIPRPETELLVERAITLIRNRAAHSLRFLDVGTGSGCIAVSVAHEVPSIKGWAVDLSSAALKVARENAIRHGVADRVLLIQSSLLDCFPLEPFLDFIFCNPPYVALTDCDSLPSEVRDYEPHLALFGGESGLQFYADLAPQVLPRLVSGGYLLLELGAGQSEQVTRIVEQEGLSVESVLSDLQGIPRCLVAVKPAGGTDG